MWAQTNAAIIREIAKKGSDHVLRIP